MIKDPFGRAIDELAELGSITLEELGLSINKNIIKKYIEEPPRDELGDLALPVFRFAKELKKSPIDIAKLIVNKAKEYETSLISKIYNISGYVNAFITVEKLAELLFKSISELGDKYGLLEVDNKQRIVIEFISANPIHPLHIGSGRNAALGDVLSRLLSARGHRIQKRFYINDMGKQVTILIYGYLALNNPKPPQNIKPDHWLGLIYAITCTLIDIKSLKKEVEELKRINSKLNEYREKLKELDELVAIAAKLRERDPDIFDKIAEAINKDPDPEERISEIMRLYEHGDERIKNIARRVINLCMEGFKETLSKLDIDFDSWDWESELVWSNDVKKVIEKALSTNYIVYHKEVPALSFDKVLDIPNIREKLRIPKTLEIPPLILMRSDGTTLYPVRDIAYTLRKFKEFKADKVINVIGAEQVLPQAQLRLALYALGYKREAENLIHYSYEMVLLPGTKMSSRRGIYVTLDELIEKAINLSLEELRKRGREDRKAAEIIGAAAIKFALASVSPSKPLILRIEDIVNFEKNSAPYLLYTYARATGILLKAKELGLDPKNPNYNSATENPKRRKLIIQLSKFPRIVAKAADDMDPEVLATYLLNLADIFNSWYSEDPVIHEPDEGRRDFKLLLVKSIRTVVGTGLKLLGIKPLERM